MKGLQAEKEALSSPWKSLTPLTGHADGGEQGHASAICACHAECYAPFRGGIPFLVPGKPKNEREWIGSYVSCQGTHVLEQTVQVARHIRCIVLRSSTEVASHCSQRIGATRWHGLCNMGIVFACFFHAQSVRLFLPHVNEDMRPAHHVPPPVRPGTPAHPLTNAVR